MSALWDKVEGGRGTSGISLKDAVFWRLVSRRVGQGFGRVVSKCAYVRIVACLCLFVKLVSHSQNGVP